MGSRSGRSGGLRLVVAFFMADASNSDTPGEAEQWCFVVVNGLDDGGVREKLQFGASGPG